jgi:hypothetical protein
MVDVWTSVHHLQKGRVYQAIHMKYLIEKTQMCELNPYTMFHEDLF